MIFAENYNFVSKWATELLDFNASELSMPMVSNAELLSLTNAQTYKNVPGFFDINCTLDGRISLFTDREILQSSIITIEGNMLFYAFSGHPGYVIGNEENETFSSSEDEENYANNFPNRLSNINFNAEKIITSEYTIVEQLSSEFSSSEYRELYIALDGILSFDSLCNIDPSVLMQLKIFANIGANIGLTAVLQALQLNGSSLEGVSLTVTNGIVSGIEIVSPNSGITEIQFVDNTMIETQDSFHVH